MGLKIFVKVILLTLIWIILREEFTPFTVTTGIIISLACIAYSRKFLPIKAIENVKPFWLIMHLFYVLGQIYLSGFYVIKAIITNARADILRSRTALTNETLRVILADSITLTPGSILLDLTEDRITAVVLIEKEDSVDNPDEWVKGSLENFLLKAQK